MSKPLELHRKYTWGCGTVEYIRDKGGVYCLTKSIRLPPDSAAEHIKNVTNYGGFRYLDEKVQPFEEVHEEACSEGSVDDVRKPSHYQVFPDVESIEIIARSMTVAEFKGFCMGNVLKYRLRAGKKSELATMEKDLKKADFYKELFEQHKAKCYE